MEALLFALRRAANEPHDTLTCGSGFFTLVSPASS